MTTALSYTVHTSPAPLRISTATHDSHATVTITVTNPGPDAVRRETITVTLPTGTDAGSLTAAPEAISVRVDDPAWSAGHRGDGVFTLHPAEPDTALAAGARITLTLSEIIVSRTAGAVALAISETAGPEAVPGERAAIHHRLPKASPDAMLEDFRPDRVTVPNGDRVTLTWKCETGPEYELFYDDQRVDVVGFIDNGNGAWPSPPLTKATAFMLLASTEKNGVPVTYGLTTAVTVDVPDLEVGDLEANGTVRLFGQTQEIPTTTQSQGTSYFADTDGVLTGYIKTTLDGAAAELTVFVTPPGVRRQKFATQSWDAIGGTDNQEASLLVPVPQGSVVRVIGKGDTFTAALTWFPFGTGPLREDTA